jgi:hypothetical protein
MVSFRKLATFCLTCFALLLWCGATASAQQVFGSVFGTVTDPSGAAVNGAKVTITDTNKGTKFEAMTNETGNYTRGELIAGTYQISIEAPGFQTVVSNPITISVDQATRFDAAMTVGNVTQQVEVTAAAPLLQSESADVQQTFSAQQIQDIPSVGRNLQAFELLQPGSEPMGWGHASDENPQGSVQMEINGQVFSAMGYELDGTTNQDPILGIIVINPNIDSVQQLTQANQNFDAEFEYVGAGVAIYSTKSGSNQYHGDAFEYLEINTPGFQDFGRNPFSGLSNTALYRENQFGGSIGGAIIKNKLFFFGDAQLVREAQGGTVLTTVPTAAERSGNLSDWLAASPNYQIYDPATGNPTTGIGRTPFPNNVIPTNRLSPQALALLQYLPLPNTNVAGTSYANNFGENGDIGITQNRWDTREDYYLNSKNTIFGRFSDAYFTQQAPGAFGELAGGPAFGNYAGNAESQDYSLALGWTNTISPTLINEFRVGWMQYHVFDVPNGYGTDPATQAGIPGLNLDKTYTSGMPAFYLNNPVGETDFGYALGVNQCNCPLTQTESQWQFVDNVSKIVGNHTFKFGTDLRWATNLRVPSDTHRAGELTFNSQITGDVLSAGGNPVGGIGLASFLLGDVSSFGRYVSSSTNAQEHQRRFFYYGQDTWRVTPKLTVNLGLRWETIFPESTSAGDGATFSLSTGLMYVFGEDGISNHGIQTMNWHNFAPRAGIAYQVSKKLVVRAGYGWAYNLGVFGSTFGHNVTQNPPVLSYQSLPQPYSFEPIFTLAQGPPAPAGFTVSSNGTFPLPAGVSPKFRAAELTLPTNYTYNGTVQYQLTNRIAVQAGYVGNSERHNWLGVTSNTLNPNEPVFQPGVSNTTLDRPYYSKLGISQDLGYYCNCSNAQYNSFQSQVTIRALAGWTLQGSYTYQLQRAIGFGYDGNYYFEYGAAYGSAPDGVGYDSGMPDNELIFTQSYNIPFGHGQKYGASSPKAVDLIAGGWILSGTTSYYSGLRFSPSLSNYGSNIQPNVGPNNRPDLGSGAVYPSNQNRNQWFLGCPNEDCSTGPYLYPASNTFGTYPIDTLIGPRYIDQDLALQKAFHLTERFALSLRMDARNAFNHTNLGSPNNGVQSATVGQITGIAFGGNNGTGMRVVQYALTLSF